MADTPKRSSKASADEAPAAQAPEGYEEAVERGYLGAQPDEEEDLTVSGVLAKKEDDKGGKS